MNLGKIIKGCIRCNPEDQKLLYLAYKDVLFTLSLKYCRNVEEAEDNLHNTFIDIFTNISKYNGNGSFEGWMKRIAINKAIDMYKKNAVLLPVKDNILDDTTVTDEEINVPEDVILQLIQQLPDQYRIVFCLYEIDNHSHKEISALLSISESTSKSNLHRAKAILKQKLINKRFFFNTVSNG